MARTDQKIDTPVTRGDSRPVRWRLISPSGHGMGTFGTALEAASAASGFWPGVGQRDEPGDGGWDIEADGL